MVEGRRCARRQDDRSDCRGHHRPTAALSQVDWVLVASSAALAGVLSLLTSIAGLPEVKAEIEE